MHVHTKRTQECTQDMSSIFKARDKWRAQIISVKDGKQVRIGKTFTTKREASEWAAAKEVELKSEAHLTPGDKTTLRDAMRRYADEVSPKHRGERWEAVRLSAFEKYNLPLDKPINKVSPDEIATFRDSRLLKLKDNSVRRELSLLSAVFEVARVDWKLVNSNPCKDIKKPPKGPHRERIISSNEIKRMLRQLGYTKGKMPRTINQVIANMMLLALRTGMRSGEICHLKWENIHSKYCFLPRTKNGKARNVPLSNKAKKIIEAMRGWNPDCVFGISPETRDAMFRDARDKAGLDGFTFHDTRHTAATMIARKIQVLDLCKMFGWSDVKNALIYYNPTPSEIADILNG